MASHHSLALVLAAIPVFAAAVSHDTLVTALEAKFPPNKTGSNVVAFVIQKEGVMAYPPGTLMVPENKVVDGNVEHSRLLGQMNTGAAALAAGTRVYVTKIESKNEMVKVHVSTMDKFDTAVVGVPTSKRMNAVLAFKFGKDFLNNATAEQVAPQITALLGPDTGAPAANGAPPTTGGGAPPPAPPPAPESPKSFEPVAPPPPPPDAAPAPPAAPAGKIAVGQTTAQVVAILGQPTRVNDLAGGKKKEFVYSDLTITFTNGKVSDVR
jgi:hypothetical protein